MGKKEHQGEHHMPWCSASDAKDSSTLGPVSTGAMAPTPCCFPVFGALEQHPPFPSPAASGLLHNNASPLVTVLVASQQLLLLEMKAVSSLAVPIPGMGTVSRSIHRQLLQQRGAWGRCFRVFAKHCGDLKCIQKATGTLSRVQTTAPPLGS